LVNLLPIGFGSGVQITLPASLIIPFQIIGNLAAATSAFGEHVKQNHLSISNCKISPQ